MLQEVRRTIDALEKFEVDISKALKYGNASHTFEDVAVRVLSGKLDAYVYPNSIILMELCQYPQHSVYHGFVAAGNLDEILAAEPSLLREARLRKCSYLSIAGRRGWEPVLRNIGWTHSLSIMVREVPSGQD